jgi:4-diphosphocytidyl-2-C-methyl-D-erythritol kinase
MTSLRALAPGKVNLCLFVGAPRADGLHPLVSVVQSVTLADELTLTRTTGGDVVRCPGVDGPNLAGTALERFKEVTGFDSASEVTIAKHVPVAAGMGGGSGDAAATLRLAAVAAGIEDETLLHELAVGLGADVPAQLRPGRALMLGAGERVVRLPDPEPFGLVIVPLDAALSTPEVYRAFDEHSPARDPEELAALEDELATGTLPPERMVNDLQDAARRLCPAIDPALEAVRGTGARVTLVSGSGPTVFGTYADRQDAEQAAATLRETYPRAVAAAPIAPGEADPRPA